ncbi:MULTISPECIES: transposase [unclassified Microcoleus]|uniref:RNA-guided endonuclease InsQ/TnpB family protein n=1 Tax=unclassified Microcoleus TaxID=2642155 RepID=UPI002FD0C4F7
MFNLTYKFKLKPTTKQAAIFEDWLELCRRVYNYSLAERKHWFGSRSCQINACSIRSEFIIPAQTKRPTYASQCLGLTAYRKTSIGLQQVQSQVLQQTLKRLEKAFVSMWEQNHGFPRFKKAGKMRSFVFPQLGANPVQGQAIKLPKIGLVKFRQSRPIPDGAKIKQARVVKRVSGWYVLLSLQWDVSVPSAMPHGEGLGIDVGLTNFIATSDGLLVKRQRFFIDAQRKLKLLQHRVSRKKPGSNNWKKAQKKVAKLHEYIANSRKDWHWKLAHQLAGNAGMIFVEDLNLIGLSRAMLGKHCLDAGWGQFFAILEQACFKHCVYFQQVDARKTSQICPNCGVETGKKTLLERTHACSSCGYTTDRDIAAARFSLNERACSRRAYRL